MPTATSSNVKQAVPFLRVTNMEGSLRFYRDGLGFRMTRAWEPDGAVRWCWLEIGDAALMLQDFRTADGGSSVPEGTLGLGVSICFTCEDALALHREFVARGVPASKPFVGNGMWVTSVKDPDGYRLDFESPTDRPEESTMDEIQTPGT